MAIGKRPSVIKDAIAALENGTLILSLHAEKQMRARDVQLSDIEEMIYRARREEHKDSIRNDGRDWKYALRGFNDDGDKDIRIIIVFHDPTTVIITVIDKNK